MLRAWPRLWRWQWRWRQREATCHFCGSASVLVPPLGDARTEVPATDMRLSSGTPARWFCSACASWNHTDEHGHILDLYERPMWDASVNDVQYATRKNDNSSPSLFCRACLANQTLVTNLLASYLPDDDEQLDEERMRAYPDYKRSLEERYPLACEACHARAMAHLQQGDQHIQRTSLASWLQRRASAPASPPSLWPWHFARLQWLLCHALGVCIPLLSPRLLVLSCLAPYPWDPCQPQIQRYRTRGVRMYAHGYGAFTCVSFSLWAARVGLYLSGHHAMPMWCAILQVLALYIAYRARYISTDAPISLVSHAASTSASHSARDPLAAMSLCEDRVAQAPLDALLEPSAAADEPEDMEVEPMDVRSMQWGPQQFGGRMSSGLEDLFGHALSLDTDRRNPRRWPWAVACALAVLGLLLLQNASGHYLGGSFGPIMSSGRTWASNSSGVSRPRPTVDSLSVRPSW